MNRKLFYVAGFFMVCSASWAGDWKSESYSALGEGRSEAALSTIRKHLEANPSDSAAAIEAASVLSGMGRHKEAEEQLRPLVAGDPGNETLRFRLATEQVFDGKVSDARTNLVVLGKSFDAEMASKAQSSLKVLDRNEAIERAARQPTRDPEQERAFRAATEKLERQQRVYKLVAQHEDEQVVEAVNVLVETHEATDALLVEQSYAFKRLGKLVAACDCLVRLGAQGKLSPGEQLTLAYLLHQTGRHTEAFNAWCAVRDGGGDPESSIQAAAEIQALAPALNFERRFWGELDLYGTYLSRYHIGVATGRLREGAFVPGARWVEPFVQADFSMDTGSKVGEGITTIYNENLAGFHAGARVRPFPSQTFVLYAMGGLQKDLLGTQKQQGKWFAEMIAGVNGYWSWGPGSCEAQLSADAQIPGGGVAKRPRRIPSQWSLQPSGPVLPRFAWFVEAGGDAAYYTRLTDFLAYLQSRQGVRLLQCGRMLSVDSYVVENLTFDSAGNYFDNFVEAGPGLRFISAPIPAATISTNVEYLGGAYLGRNSGNTRGNTAPTYSDFRVTVSLGLRW